MARVRVLRRQEKGYIELPPDVASEGELELFALRDGYYLLSRPLPGQAGRQGEGLSEGERAVLKRLLAIRFENRTPEQVGKALSAPELEILGGLEARGLVNIFRGSKYKEGVYNISDSTYGLVYPKSVSGSGTGRQGGRGEEGARPPRPGPVSGTMGELHSRGFIIVQDKREAIALSELLGAKMKSGEVLGVKGFDGKFYIVTKDYFSGAQRAVSAALKDEMDAPSIASAAKLDSEGCVAVLRLMAEAGEIIEKKRGVFAPV